MYSTDPQVVNRLTSPSNNAGVFATSRSGTGLGSNHFSSGASTGRTVMSSASSHTSAAADRTVSPQRIADRIRAQYHAAIVAEGVDSVSGPSSPRNDYNGGSGTPSVMSLYDDGIGGIEGVDTNLALQLLFQYYCRFGRSGKTTELETMDNAMFAKFLRDTPCLLDRRLTPTEGDLIFFKCKEKASRRINYSQWLDTLAAFASIKFSDSTSDTASNFSSLLSQYILVNPAAIGIAQAVRAGLITVGNDSVGNISAHASSVPSSSSRSQSRSRSITRAQSPSNRNSTTSQTNSVGVGGGGGGNTQAQVQSSSQGLHSSTSTSARAASVSASSTSILPSVPDSYVAHLQAAAAQMAALAAQAQNAADTVAAAAMGAPPPAAVYELLAQKALELQSAAAAAAAGVAVNAAMSTAAAATTRSSTPGPLTSSRTAASTATSAVMGEASIRSLGGASTGGASARSTSARSASREPTAVSRTEAARNGLLGGLGSPNPFRAISMRDGDFVISAQSLGVAGSGASKQREAAQSVGTMRYSTLGSKEFRPALAGEANAPGSVFERLADPGSFTGVYRRAWETDGRINQYTETCASMKQSLYTGNTNTATDEHVTDIGLRGFMRPNLLTGGPSGLKVNDLTPKRSKTPMRAY